jgi:hypothetical protein
LELGARKGKKDKDNSDGGGRQGKKTKDKPDFAKRKSRKKKNIKTRQKAGNTGRTHSPSTAGLTAGFGCRFCRRRRQSVTGLSFFVAF